MANNFAAQGGNTEADDAATRLVGDLFAEVQPDSMVTKFVIVAETIDAEGERCVSSFTSIGLKRWDSMGLLQFALACENDRTVLGHGHDDEDDD